MKLLSNGLYDTGAIAKEIQESFKIFVREPIASRNKATPEHLSVLLDKLSTLTQSVQEARDQMSDWTPDAGVPHWDRSMEAWKGRLLHYQNAVAAAPPGDRRAVLWTVTAPLLIGYYGGEGSKQPQSVMDAVTPFSLTNQLTVGARWRRERWDAFKDDVQKAIEWWAWGALAIPVALGAAVIYSILRKK